ncbi:MAG: asparaginase domain-containing protein, partial [Vicinamibacterales bacterium]
MSIRILVTGGTFDKEYDELTGRLFFRDTHVPEMLRLGRARLDLAVETVMMIDSLDMTDEGRAAIVERCRSCSERAIVITHGTDTMVDTARAIGTAGLANKTIVLTGAMVP